MTNTIVGIQYWRPDETGVAEVLGAGTLARVLETPWGAPFCRNSIVRLDRDPATTDGVRSVEEVVYEPYPGWWDLPFGRPEDGTLRRTAPCFATSSGCSAATPTCSAWHRRIARAC
jgi:hypothetical protein